MCGAPTIPRPPCARVSRGQSLVLRSPSRYEPPLTAASRSGRRPPARVWYDAPLLLVWLTRFERATSAPPARCSAKLSHSQSLFVRLKMVGTPGVEPGFSSPRTRRISAFLGPDVVPTASSGPPLAWLPDLAGRGKIHGNPLTRLCLRLPPCHGRYFGDCGEAGSRTPAHRLRGGCST